MKCEKTQHITSTVRRWNILSLLLFAFCCHHHMSTTHNLSHSAGQSSNDQREDKAETRQSNALVISDQNGDDDDAEVMDDIDESEDVNMEPFFATRDWQTLKPGQRAPAGLHIRLNLETGEREAKLLDNADEENKDEKGDGRQHSMEKLKKAIQDFKVNEVDDEMEETQKEEIRRKFRSYEELKDDLEEINMGIKTDAEIITELVFKLNSSKPGNTEDLMREVLIDLEYYLHQIDNAQLFCGLGGMKILIAMLKDNNSALRSEVTSAIGAAVQSNPEVQAVAFENGALGALLRTLSSSSAMSSLQKKALFAMSGLLRHFYAVQEQFVHLGGLTILKLLFNSSPDEAVQLRVVTLLHDLLTDGQENEHSLNPVRSQHRLSLLTTMMDHGWCDSIPNLLESRDHDTREKVLIAMATLLEPCRESFVQFHPVLTRLVLEYHTLSIQETADNRVDNDQYFADLKASIQNLIKHLSVKQEL